MNTLVQQTQFFWATLMSPLRTKYVSVDVEFNKTKAAGFAYRPEFRWILTLSLKFRTEKLMVVDSYQFNKTPNNFQQHLYFSTFPVRNLAECRWHQNSSRNSTGIQVGNAENFAYYHCWELLKNLCANKYQIHTTYSWNIKWQKCARMGLIGFPIR